MGTKRLKFRIQARTLGITSWLVFIATILYFPKIFWRVEIVKMIENVIELVGNEESEKVMHSGQFFEINIWVQLVLKVENSGSIFCGRSEFSVKQIIVILQPVL